MYSFDSRIRYSEIDPDGKLRIESLIDYFQDCCSFQSEDGGVGLDYTREHHIAWLVNFWQIDILRRPRLGERVRITTIPYDFKGFVGYRNCTMEVLGDAGMPAAAVDSSCQHVKELVARSNSVWSLINLDKNLPVRIPEEMFRAYPLDQKLDMEYLPRKIRLPKEADTVADIHVQGRSDTRHLAKEADTAASDTQSVSGLRISDMDSSHAASSCTKRKTTGVVRYSNVVPVPVTAAMIDSNRHVNNAQYVRLALSVLVNTVAAKAGDDTIRRLCVEYVRQARLGDVIIPEIYVDGSRQTVSLNSQKDNKPFAIVQIQV